MANGKLNAIRCDVGGELWLVLLLFFSCVVSFVPAVNGQTASSVRIDIISSYPSQQYDTALESKTNAAFQALNSSSCSDISNAVSPDTDGKILSCEVDHFENASQGVNAVINITVELGDKTATERFTLIKSAVIGAASTSSTWMVSDGDVTLVQSSTPPPAATVEITMTVKSKRYDLVYNTQLSDPKQFVYRTQTNTMCADIINALDPIATVTSCEVERFEPIPSEGLKAYMKVKATVPGKDEQEGFLTAGKAIIDAAAKEKRWDVIDKDISLMPAKKPDINPTVRVHLKLFSTRTDLTMSGTSNSSLNATMCDDVLQALYYTAIVKSCEASNFTPADSGVKALINLTVDMEAKSPVDGFLVASEKIISESEKREAWIVNDPDISYISGETITTTTTNPRSAASHTAQLPLVFLSLYVLTQVISS